jgi:glycine/D-amino acid oxidase-like deaminating enzyme
MSGVRHVDAVVVGGGILGCSAALHLKLRGCDSVTLVERDRIGAGASGAGAGLLARWSAGFVPAWGDAELELETYGLDFYRELSACDYDLGYLGTGVLFVGSARAAGQRSLLPLAHHDAAEDRAVLTSSGSGSSPKASSGLREWRGESWIAAELASRRPRLPADSRVASPNWVGSTSSTSPSGPSAVDGPAGSCSTPAPARWAARPWWSRPGRGPTPS